MKDMSFALGSVDVILGYVSEEASVVYCFEIIIILMWLLLVASHFAVSARKNNYNFPSQNLLVFDIVAQRAGVENFTHA